MLVLKAELRKCTHTHLQRSKHFAWKCNISSHISLKSEVSAGSCVYIGVIPNFSGLGRQSSVLLSAGPYADIPAPEGWMDSEPRTITQAKCLS